MVQLFAISPFIVHLPTFSCYHYNSWWNEQSVRLINLQLNLLCFTEDEHTFLTQLATVQASMVYTCFLALGVQ